ncbi:MAG: T9SS type A sorting domain-containing protein [Balneolales bacterium]|nr:T9SS type A sorting domain-containing protein [Balneolales bacterium]
MKRSLGRILYQTVAINLFTCTLVLGQITIDGNMSDWSEDMRVDGSSIEGSEFTNISINEGAENLDLRFEAIYATDDEDFLYVRIVMKEGADVRKIMTDYEELGTSNQRIEIYLSIDPDSDQSFGDNTGMTWDWYNSGLDFLIRLYPFESEWFQNTYGIQNQLREHSQATSGYAFNSYQNLAETRAAGEPILGPNIQWDADYNSVEFSLPKSAIHNPKNLPDFEGSNYIAFVLQSGVGSTSYRVSNSGVQGFIYEFSPPEEETYTVEVTGDAGWRMFSLPIQDATVADLASQNLIQGISGANAFYTDYPSIEFESNVGSNLFFYSNNTDWVAPTNMNSQIQSGNGFIWAFYNNEVGPSSELPFTLSLTGTEPSADVVIDVHEGFNLIGNPFSREIDINAIADNEEILHDNILIWNSSEAGNSGGNHFFESMSLESASKIGAWQGFLVEASTAGQILIPVTAKNDTPGTLLKNLAMLRTDISLELLSFSESGNITSIDRSSKLVFHENATMDWDKYDGSLFSPLDSKSSFLSFEGNRYGSTVYQSSKSVPFDLTDEVEIPLHLFGQNENVKHVLQWGNMENLPDNLSMFLIDNLSGTITDMQEVQDVEILGDIMVSKTVVDLDNPRVSDRNEARFVILVSPNVTSIPHETTPNSFTLSQNYPNPFNPTTTITFSLDREAYVNLSVFDVTGRLITTLVNETRSAGAHNINLDATGLSSGIYFYRIESNGVILTKKMTLNK